jgi:hypothetical protein
MFGRIAGQTAGFSASDNSPEWNLNSTRQGDHMAKRTTHRSRSGTKLYAVRDKKGRFVDIQTYKRAHGTDIKRKAKTEKRKSR